MKKWEYMWAKIKLYYGSPIIYCKFYDKWVSCKKENLPIEHLTDRGWELLFIKKGIAYFKRPKKEE